MKVHTLFTTALLIVFPVASQAAATEESAPVRQQEVSDPTMGRDVAATSAETNLVPENLQAARQPDELLLGDIKILPSF